MFQIVLFMESYQVKNAAPQPSRSVEIFLVLYFDFARPCLAIRRLHLPSMRATDNSSHETSDRNCLGPSQPFQFELEILGPQFSDENLLSRDLGRNHALP